MILISLGYYLFANNENAMTNVSHIINAYKMNNYSLNAHSNDERFLSF